MLKATVLFCPQPKDIHYIAIEEERNQEILKFKKLESEDFGFFSFKKSTQAA